ncbi:adenosylmethionine--8-amino-7-oxononanoate transaminase [Nonlabens xiamenensis]|uniref:adenosylmethionine--8-amino-7-oxononanoate transaminase n=1 Tax=Nonlabens xiamenensis TaxID=2341043 RepID=UPI000F611E69|nr:adenosylmethionine--8-amino-7-oxononanoate transaminase [Nonlabens xiamenensis]
MTKEELLALDQANIWHPLTQHKTAAVPIAIASAEGNYLYDMERKSYFDGISSWYTCSYGHRHPVLIKAMKEQLDHLHHVVFAGMTHEPAARLSQSLLDILPENQAKLFFSENGSTSVEIALKMAFQYHFNRDEKRPLVVALEGGFHGDTFGAMSASGLSVYNGPFEDFFIDVRRIPVPTPDNLEQVLAQVDQLAQDRQVASFIYEPLIQGAAAMKMHRPEELDIVLKRWQHHGVLTIADEVMTGFGKTGSFFASDQMHSQPDIICLSKALTGGIMPMAITTCTSKVFEAFYDDELAKGLFHGHTYSGNPLGCAVANAAIGLLESVPIQEGITQITASQKDFVQSLQSHQSVASIRSKGVIMALDLNIQMQRYGYQRNQIFQWFWNRGLFIRPLGNTIYLVPPFTTQQDQLKTAQELIIQFLDGISSGAIFKI